jgi:hypothetical protein
LECWLKGAVQKVAGVCVCLHSCVCVCVFEFVCVCVCVYSGSQRADKGLLQAPSRVLGQYNTGTELPDSGGQ